MSRWNIPVIRGLIHRYSSSSSSRRDSNRLATLRTELNLRSSNLMPAPRTEFRRRSRSLSLSYGLGYGLSGGFSTVALCLVNWLAY